MKEEKQEKQVHFFALQKVVTVDEFINSIHEPEGSIGLSEKYEAIRNNQIDILN